MSADTPDRHTSSADRAALMQSLAFFADAGVDCMLLDTPANRLEERAATPSAPRRQVPTAGAPARAAASLPAPERTTTLPPRDLAVPDEATIRDAREAARSAATLDELRSVLSGFTGCNLRYTAKNLVFADGNPQAEIMFVGEAPGREEDLQGLPFVGRAGQLLDRMLSAIGLDRTSAYITNIIPWRPPGNRAPTPHEVELCRPFIERHILLANPKVLVMLGGVSAKTMLGTTRGILALRGKWATVALGEDGREFPAMPTLHPAYLLRQPAQKKLVWRDLLAVRQRLEAPPD